MKAVSYTHLLLSHEAEGIVIMSQYCPVGHFPVKCGKYADVYKRQPLPDVRVLEPGELGRNFARILEEVRELFPCE